MTAPLSRRALLKSGGALIVSFSLLRTIPALADDPPPKLPGSLQQAPFLDSWIKIDRDGITVFTGKAELGQGIKTALIQIAADELEVPFEAIRLITADTARTANEGFTAGSQSIENSGGAIQNAAAQVREILLNLAAARFNTDVATLKADNGTVVAVDGRRLTYLDLVSGDVLHVQAQPKSKLKNPAAHTIIGREVKRIDIPAKVTGGVAYVQDLRLDGMVHARLVRPPSPGATLAAVDTAAVDQLPGVIKVVHNGNFLAVIAEGEFQAINAMNALAGAAKWQGGKGLPDPKMLDAVLRSLPVDSRPIKDVAATTSPAATTISAQYHRPYQMHASIGPSCAVGLMDGNALTVWTHTQGVYPDRDAIAQLMSMDKGKVRLIHMEGSGCYGHNGADDAAADAALLARELPGRPVRVQWMREQEHGWEPYGSAMSSDAKASLDANGRIVDWQYAVWSSTHSMRPGSAGNLLAGQLIENPFTPDAPMPIPQPAGGGDRNAIPLYAFPTMKVLNNFIAEMPLRVSALRSLGAYMNVFSVESFMDELALAAKIDPVTFRLNHLADPRAIDVVMMAADKFGWSATGDMPRGRGQGFAFAKYKNLATYCAVAVEVEVNGATGDVRPIRAVAACDSGMAINPDGIRNQIEGAIIQSTSWTLFEEVRFSAESITSRDWGTYPILRFPDVPAVEVHVIDRPDQEPLGAGEAGQGPTAAAIANAVFDATGVRVRELPLSRARAKLAIGA